MSRGAHGQQSGLEPYVARIHAQWARSAPPDGWAALDASLVLLDISGFTALSERLEGLGRAGAEVLTGLINDVFAAVLASAPDLDGDILRFGGDAALVLLEGAGHERRAARLAGDMQRALKRFARVRTEVGDTAISGSIGVASGEVALHVVGDSHRDLIILGDATREVVQLESRARPGEVLVAPGTAAALPSDAVSPRGALALDVAVGPTAGGPERTPPPAEGLRLALPVKVREHLDKADGTLDAEHRRVPVAFVRATLSERLSAPAAGDARHAAIAEVVRAAQAACARYDTTFLASDVDLDAFKITLATGVPVAVERADERLVLTLAEIVLADRPDLRVRAGAHRGPLFAADVGAPHRRGWTLMGDTVNTAARVMSNAPQGGVLATRELSERLPATFARRPVTPFAAKGKTEPIRADLIEPQVSAGTTVVAQREHLVGRAAELALLDERLAAAAAGKGSVLALVGPAGIGKSTLLRAAVGAHRGTRLVVEGGLYGRHTPYLALHAPLRALLGVPPTDDPAEQLRRHVVATHPELEPWLPLVGAVLGIAVEETATTTALRPEFRRTRLHAVVGELLEHSLSSAGPGALISVDESQWLDEPSRELLRVLAEQAVDRGWTVIEAIRTVPQDVSGLLAVDAMVHELRPLDDDASRTIVEELLVTRGIGIQPPVRSALVEHGSGNPLFLQELARTVSRDGGLGETPDTLEELVGGRIDALPSRRRRFVRQVAVLGMRFPPQLAADLLDLPLADVVAELSALDGLFAFEASGQAVFRHGMLREVAYQALPFARRRELHGRAGRLLLGGSDDPDSQAQLLSTHFHVARDHAASWRWSRVAGRAALEAAAPLDAIVFLERAVAAGRILRGLPRREVSELFEILGDTYERAGRYPDAAKAYARARSFATEAVLTRARLCLKTGILADRTGDYSRGRGWFTRGENLLRRSEIAADRRAISLRAQLGRAQGAFLLRQGRPAQALARLEPAADDARRSGDRSTLANVSYLLAWACGELGHPLFETYRDAARPIYEELGDDYGLATALNNLGADAYDAGDWDEAVRYYERSAVARERAGDLVHLSHTFYNVGEVLIHQGRFAEGERENQRARATCGPGYALGTAMCDMLDGISLLLQGELDAAAAPLATASAALADLRATSILLEARVAECARLVGLGLAAQAAAVLEELAPQAQSGGPLERTRLARARSLVRRCEGDDGRALDEARTAIAVATEHGLPYEELLALAAALACEPAGPEAAGRRARSLELRARLDIIREL